MDGEGFCQKNNIHIRSALFPSLKSKLFNRTILYLEFRIVIKFQVIRFDLKEFHLLREYVEDMENQRERERKG